MSIPKVLTQLTDLGVSMWLDDLNRDRITSGSLQGLIDTRCVRGVTTNPTIFAKAISGHSAAYDAQLTSLAAAGADAEGAVRAMTTDDVRSACDLFNDLFISSGGVDGHVSIEVDPRLAHDTHATIAQARELWDEVARPNVLIKVPATLAGLPAITEVLSYGISVNVTLIFSLERYAAVLQAWQAGLEKALLRGHEPTGIHSVASFFVSRLDTSVDQRLTDLGTAEALQLQGSAALASARLAWGLYTDALSQSRWSLLREQGAHPQRPLWASTGVKNPAYDDTRYVIGLAAPGCVNTMPEKTLMAVADHGQFDGDTVTDTQAASADVWHRLNELGIDQAQVCAELEAAGVASFADSWQDLLDSVDQRLRDLK
ncbi:MAG: transaldolase [Candidatus Nanopelagicales bacterium]|jgi:transaldolase|nr:transaldolase [Candidatus Nanopelagicales bacterium]MDP4825974.1 transaldolase [Candidatus Nanopelagicales bacterium]MDP4888834.1 transaldolase [Candidatus Nanopelagicales bacterium]